MNIRRSILAAVLALRRTPEYSNDDSGNNVEEEYLPQCRVNGKAAPPSACMKPAAQRLARSARAYCGRSLSGGRFRFPDVRILSRVRRMLKNPGSKCTSERCDLRR